VTHRHDERCGKSGDGKLDGGKDAAEGRSVKAKRIGVRNGVDSVCDFMVPEVTATK
jgi:hypothetical protein